MKMPCDSVTSWSNYDSSAEKKTMAQAFGVDYEAALQSIIDEKGVEFVKNFIGDKDNDFVSLEWDLAVKRLKATLDNSNWNSEIIISNDGGRYVNINLPFNAYIASSFKKDEAKKLNEFCKFLEGGI